MEEDLIEHNNKIIEDLTKSLRGHFGIFISRDDVFAALFLIYDHKNDFEWMADLWDIKLEFEQALNDLKGFDFELLQADVVSAYEIIEDIKLYERKAILKAAGAIWKIHLYDSDPFPSNPHAHNLDENIKLHLGNGDCFRKRKYLKTIPKKDLLKIREQAEIYFKGNLPELIV